MSHTSIICFLSSSSQQNRNSKVLVITITVLHNMTAHVWYAGPCGRICSSRAVNPTVDGREGGQLETTWTAPRAAATAASCSHRRKPRKNIIHPLIFLLLIIVCGRLNGATAGGEIPACRDVGHDYGDASSRLALDGGCAECECNPPDVDLGGAEQDEVCQPHVLLGTGGGVDLARLKTQHNDDTSTRIVALAMLAGLILGVAIGVAIGSAGHYPNPQTLLGHIQLGFSDRSLECEFTTKQFPTTLASMSRTCVLGGSLCALLGVVHHRPEFMLGFAFLVMYICIKKVVARKPFELARLALGRGIVTCSVLVATLNRYVDSTGATTVVRDSPTIIVCCALYWLVGFHMRFGGSIYPLHRALFCGTICAHALSCPADFTSFGRPLFLSSVAASALGGELVGWFVERYLRREFVQFRAPSATELSSSDGHGSSAPTHEEERSAHPPAGSAHPTPGAIELSAEDQQSLQRAFAERQFRSSVNIMRRFLIGTGVLFALSSGALIRSSGLVGSCTCFALCAYVQFVVARKPTFELGRQALGRGFVGFGAIALVTVHSLKAVSPEHQPGGDYSGLNISVRCLIWMLMSFHIRFVMVATTHRTIFSAMVILNAMAQTTSADVETNALTLGFATALVLGELVGGIAVHVVHVLHANNHFASKLERRRHLRQEARATQLALVEKRTTDLRVCKAVERSQVREKNSLLIICPSLELTAAATQRTIDQEIGKLELDEQTSVRSVQLSFEDFALNSILQVLAEPSIRAAAPAASSTSRLLLLF